MIASVPDITKSPFQTVGAIKCSATGELQRVVDSCDRMFLDELSTDHNLIDCACGFSAVPDPAALARGASSQARSPATSTAVASVVCSHSLSFGRVPTTASRPQSERRCKIGEYTVMTVMHPTALVGAR